MIKSVFLMIVLSMLFLVGCQDSKTTTPVKEILFEKNKVEIEKILVKWVYDNSKNISMGTSQSIVKEAMKTNKSLLLLATIEVESSFNPGAVSSKGAMGLMQVMPGVHEKSLIAKGFIKERRDLFDIGPSIQSGNFVLDSCLVQSKNDVSKALELYLGGQDGYYVKRIFSHLANLYILTR